MGQGEKMFALLKAFVMFEYIFMTQCFFPKFYVTHHEN